MNNQKILNEDIIDKKFRSLNHLIGNTPLIEIKYKYKSKKQRLFAKSENLNMTGSIKDRMAVHILKKAYDCGAIKPGDIIAEATSGNTGISFSAIGKALGHKVVIFMPDWMSRERKDLISSMGAEIIQVSKEQGGFVGAIKLSEEFKNKNENVFLPCQFSNIANCEAHYLNTAVEIWWQLQFLGLIPDVFCAGVGTGGTIMGVGKRFKELNSKIKAYPIEPAESPILTAGHKVGSHRIQGISDEFIPPILDLSSIDEIISVHDGDAIIMAQKLSNELGIAVGISSGANFIGAVIAQNILGDHATVVTVFPDSNKKYLSTDLLKKEPVKNEYISPHIKLEEYFVMKRVCATCCDYVQCEQKIFNE